MKLRISSHNPFFASTIKTLCIYTCLKMTGRVRVLVPLLVVLQLTRILTLV